MKFKLVFHVEARPGSFAIEIVEKSQIILDVPDGADRRDIEHTIEAGFIVQRKFVARKIMAYLGIPEDTVESLIERAMRTHHESSVPQPEDGQQ